MSWRLGHTDPLRNTFVRSSRRLGRRCREPIVLGMMNLSVRNSASMVTIHLLLRYPGSPYGPAWTWNGSGVVSVNVLSLHAMLQGIPWNIDLSQGFLLTSWWQKCCVKLTNNAPRGPFTATTLTPFPRYDHRGDEWLDDKLLLIVSHQKRIWKLLDFCQFFWYTPGCSSECEDGCSFVDEVVWFTSFYNLFLGMLEYIRIKCWIMCSSPSIRMGWGRISHKFVDTQVFGAKAHLQSSSSDMIDGLA